MASLLLPKGDLPSAGEYALTKFKLFKDFPYEIRHTIWELGLPGPRVVRIKSKKIIQNTQRAAHRSTRSQRCGGMRAPWSIAMIPALLHVNYEARTFALKHYTLSFGSFLAVGRGPIYFDWAKDVLYFQRYEDVNAFYGGRCVPVEDKRFLQKSLKNLTIGGTVDEHSPGTWVRVSKYENLSSFTLQQSKAPAGYAVGTDEQGRIDRDVTVGMKKLWTDRGMARDKLPLIHLVTKKDIRKDAKEDHKEMRRRTSSRKLREKLEKIKKVARALKRGGKGLLSKLWE